MSIPPTDRSPAEEVVRTLRGRLAGAADPVPILGDAFGGRSAIVLSAGPSLGRWREVLDRERENDPLIVCVKQAILEVGERCDLHFVNPYNHRRYDGIAGERLVLYTDVPGAPRTFGRRDVTFRIVKPSRAGIEQSLAARRDFARWDLSVSGADRPWGPGIMYESVLFTLLHMGVQRVVTAGWDVADEKGGNRHFYDAAAPAMKGRGAVRSRALGLPLLGTVARFGLHWTGRTYNRPALLPGEAETVAESLEDCLRWFERQGMIVRVVSESTWIRRYCPAFVHCI